MYHDCISLDGVDLKFSDTVMHLGHLLSYNLDDTPDIIRVTKDLNRKVWWPGWLTSVFLFIRGQSTLNWSQSRVPGVVITRVLRVLAKLRINRTRLAVN